jgi:hypothetical protein
MAALLHAAWDCESADLVMGRALGWANGWQ